MLVETCRIVAVSDTEMWLESRARRDCVACAKGVGCGGGLLAKLTRQPVNLLRLPRDERVNTNEFWRIAIPEKLLLLGAVISYCLPLIFCLVIAISFSLAVPSVPDAVVALSSFSGLFFGHLVARWLATRIDFSRQIQVLEPVALPCWAETKAGSAETF